MIDNARIQGKKKGRNRGGQMGAPGRWFMRVGILVLAVAGLSVMTVGGTQADDQPLPMMSVGYQDGTITAIYQASFQIDGRTYSLTPDAIILDDSGKRLDAGMLAVTLKVKYHVKKEQTEKIDRMILFLSR